MISQLADLLQFLQYIAIGGGMSFVGYLIMLIGSSHGIPEHLIVAIFNLFGVTITGAINLTTTFSGAKISFWKGLVENNAVRLVMGLAVSPLIIWALSHLGVGQAIAYWGALSLSGLCSFCILKHLYQA